MGNQPPSIEIFNDACYKNDIKTINYLIHIHSCVSFEVGMWYACMGGHMEIVEMMIKLGAKDFNMGLLYACDGCKKNTTNYMIKLGADDFQRAFTIAKERNYICMTDLITVNQRLINACKNNNIQLALLMISNGAKCLDIGFNLCLLNNNYNLAEILISNGVKYDKYKSNGTKCNIFDRLRYKVHKDNRGFEKYRKKIRLLDSVFCKDVVTEIIKYL